MPAMRNAAGKVIGATDGPGRGSCSLFACNKTATDRMRLGCTPRRSLSLDEAMIDQEDTEVADSAQARRILAACAGTLDTSDMGLVIDLLSHAGKLNASEASALKEKLNPESTMGVAEDHRRPSKFLRGLLPDNDRLNSDNGRGSFNDRYPDAARIRHLDFPHQDRLK